MRFRVLVACMLVCVACFVSLAAADDAFVAIQGDQFTYKGQPWRMKGSNYYPKNHMWADMWNSWDWSEITNEVSMMRSLGLNCVRILVPYSNGGWNGPNPPADRLQKLEDLVNLLGTNGIRSCVTLFDWETSFPAAGTTKEADHLSYLNAIVGRLSDNKNVFMWDVKNEPDHPANIGGGDNWDTNPIARDKIVSWLHRMCDACRAIDSNHPASAGLRWWQNIEDVTDFVDVAIFHSYWPNVAQEITDARSYMGASQKPILCEEFGWPTNPNPCLRDGVLIYDYNEAVQLSLYTTHLDAFESYNIAGCIQWMTFDAKNYTTNQSESFENYFGLWKYDYTLKPAGAYYRDHFAVTQFPDSVPPASPTQLKAYPAESSIRLTWTNPADADLRGVVIRYKTTGYPTGPADGLLACDRAAIPSSIDTFTQTGLTDGVAYYFSVFAYDAGPNYSAAATATNVPGRVSCGTIKRLADNSSIALDGVVVTGVFASDGCTYVEDQDRASGIRVASSGSGLSVGDIVVVTGTITTRKPDSITPSERQISSPTITTTGRVRLLAPLVMACRSVGGGPAGPMVPGVQGGVGLNNIGLLVRLSGTVTLKVGSYIYVDDGSEVPDILDRTGVMVKCPDTAAPVSVGDIVSVTGIVEGSIPLGWTTNRRMLQLRTYADLVRVR